eukprot:6202846-Pleurochrysis_carterae.AAC.3
MAHLGLMFTPVCAQSRVEYTCDGEYLSRTVGITSFKGDDLGEISTIGRWKFHVEHSRRIALRYTSSRLRLSDCKRIRGLSEEKLRARPW